MPNGTYGGVRGRLNPPYSIRVKVPNPPGSGKDTAESKGAHREVGSEGSRMWEQTNHGQTSDLTNRNHI